MNLEHFKVEYYYRLRTELYYIIGKADVDIKIDTTTKNYGGKSVPVLVLSGHIKTGEMGDISIDEKYKAILNRLVERTVRALVYELLYNQIVVLGNSELRFVAVETSNVLVDINKVYR